MNDNMSFLPEDYIERRIEQRTNMICLSLFVIVLLGVGGAYMMTSAQRSEVRAQAQQVNAAFTDAARRLEQLDELQSRKQQMLRKAQVTATLLEPVPRTFLLADLINRMPATLSLFELQVDSRLIQPTIMRTATPANARGSALANQTASADQKTNAPPPVPRYAVSLVMIGVAPTDVQVAQYMSALTRSHLVNDVNLVFSEESRVQDANMRRFRIEMTLDPAADVRRLDPLRKDRLRDPLREPSIATPPPDEADLDFADVLPGALRHLEQPR